MKRSTERILTHARRQSGPARRARPASEIEGSQRALRRGCLHAAGPRGGGRRRPAPGRGRYRYRHRRRARQGELLRLRGGALQRLRAQAGAARAGGQSPQREPRVPGVPGLLRVVRAHRRVGGRPGRRPRPRDRRVHRAGQLQGPGGGPGRHRESEVGAQGPAPRRRVHAGHRAVLHLRHAGERVLPHRRGIRAGAGRCPPRGVPRHRGRGLRAPGRRSAAGHLLHDESGRQREGLPDVGGATGRGHQLRAARHPAASRSAFTRATASTSARASTTWS